MMLYSELAALGSYSGPDSRNTKTKGTFPSLKKTQVHCKYVEAEICESGGQRRQEGRS